MDSVEGLEFLLLLKADMLAGQTQFKRKSGVPPLLSHSSSAGSFCYSMPLRTLCRTWGVLNVSSQIGQKCKSESTSKHSPCSAKHYFDAAQQIGHYTDWTGQIAINNGALFKQPLFSNPLLLPLRALPVSSLLFFFSLSPSLSLLPLSILSRCWRTAAATWNATLNNKIKHHILVRDGRKEGRRKEGGRREWEVRKQWVARAKHSNRKRQQASGFSLSLSLPPSHRSPKGLMSPHLRRTAAIHQKANIMYLTSHNESPKCSRPSPLCVLRTQHNQFQMDSINIC